MRGLKGNLLKPNWAARSPGRRTSGIDSFAGYMRANAASEVPTSRSVSAMDWPPFHQ